MITEIRLQNARIYDDKDWAFPLTGLTILCGTNSAGKSTVLKCLLLLAQNVTGRGPTSSLRRGLTLKFSNPYSDLGNFRSFVSHNAVERELHLGVSIESLMQAENYRFLDPSISGGNFGGATDELPDYRRYSLDADFYFCALQSFVTLDPSRSQQVLDLKSEAEDGDEVSEHQAVLRLGRFRITGEDGRILVEFDVKRVSRESGNGVDYILRMPKNLLESGIEGVAYDYDEDADPAYGLLRLLMSGILPERVFRGQKALSSAPEEAVSRYLALPTYLEEAFGDLRSSLTRIVYLGPLRAAARRFYPIHSDPSFFSDATGETLPLLLRDRGASVVTSAAPVTHSPVRCALAEAVDSWLFFLRTGSHDRARYSKREIKISSMEDAFVELGIRSSGGAETHALADSGFGYSQLLPILVRGLMLVPGGTLIVEQPEVHLNPSLQVRLCDFLVAMASVNKQIIVETHSEHVVNAVRALTAEGAQIVARGGCTVLYLDTADGRPHLHKLSLLPDGSIPDWPEGFFGEAAQLLGRIMRAKTGLKV